MAKTENSKKIMNCADKSLGDFNRPFIHHLKLLLQIYDSVQMINWVAKEQTIGVTVISLVIC
jgi:hypothetical protein